MLAMLFDQINAIPRGIVNGTMDLTQFVGGKLDLIADGLSGGGGGGAPGSASLDDPFTKEHVAFMENARRTRPVNYKNLAGICTKMMSNPDQVQRKERIMNAFN
jgi:hypothetical protein